MNATPQILASSKREPESEILTDMTKRIHRVAQESTPSKVAIPESLTGVIFWMLGQYGPISLFVMSTWFLYNDGKANQAQTQRDSRESQAQMLEVAKAQIAVNAQVVAQMTEVKYAISSLVEEAKRAHKSP